MNQFPVYSVDKKEFKTVTGLFKYLIKKHQAHEMSSVGKDRKLCLYRDRETIAVYDVSPPKIGEPTYLTATMLKNPSRPNPAHLKAQAKFYGKRNPLPYPPIKRKVVTRPVFRFEIKTADGWKKVQGVARSKLAAKRIAMKVATHYHKPVKVFSNAT